MDLQTLKYFCAVADERSFIRASQKLGYAQSNLSVRIQQLEKELGTELFTRSASGVSLTEKGEVMLRYAVKILALSDEAKNSVQGTAISRDTFRLGSMESSAVSFLPGLLSYFHGAMKEINISVTTANSEVLTRKVLARELDGAFIAGASEHDGLNSVHVRNETLTLLGSSSLKDIHGTRRLLSQPLVVFPSGCSYRKILEQWLRDENIVPSGITELGSLGAVVASISAGLGVGLLPVMAVKMFTASGSLCLHEVPEKYRTAEIKFITRKSKWHDVVLEKVIEMIRQKGED